MAAPAAAGKHCLAGRQLTNAHRRHIVGMLRHEVAVNRLIMLTIVTNEEPFDLRKFARQALQIAAACARDRCGTSDQPWVPSR